ncbi:MAG: flippase-like domain-containing protein [Nanoarchaeota archaeon]|nr:flippase-like domain-containing protein [Nanoarchaeota archaeon]MBU1501356.1 flippase-like domain-containing protein [Nanoarchaeota archaeon]MBU2443767.1 flippase-like domain-containing protein [Nanoarchaeota archaeon]
MRKGLNLIFSLLFGLAVFGFFFYRSGVEEVFSVFANIQPLYIGIFFFISSLTFVPTVWRWGIVLNAHKKTIPFLSLLKYTIVGYAVSYVTPSVKVGGEPLRAYMLNKEYKVDLKTASSSIIIEKFVEFLGGVILGLIGFALFFSLPGINILIKLIVGISLLIGFVLLTILYYRSVTGKGSFSTLFVFFRLNKIARWKNFVYTIRGVEKHMHKFFAESKKAFFLSFLTYLLYMILVVFEFKFLLLGLGIDESLRTVLLSITVAGFVNFIPVPAALGFLEAGQASLFSLVRKEGSIGFALSIVTRIRALIFVAIGFSLITYFSGNRIGEKVSLFGCKKKNSSKKGKG